MTQALFLFASIGVVNGILLSLFLLTKKQRQASDLFFAGMIMSLCIRIGKSVVVYFTQDPDRLILQIGLSACVFVGPFFYLYVKSVLRGESEVKKKDGLLLSLLLVTIITLGIIWPYPTQPEVWNSYMVRGIYIVWGGFMLAGFYELRPLLTKLIKQPKVLTYKERYVLAIVLSIVFITLTYQFALFIQGFTYIWGSLIFSVSFYYLAARAVLSKKPVVPRSSSGPALENGADLLDQIERYVTEQKPYINQKLKLDELAAALGMSRHLLSQVLNEEYHHGFAHYIKEHRVNEAKKLIQVRHELSLEGIGYESGFNSKSAFFEAFKKVTESTPAAYRKQVLQD